LFQGHTLKQVPQPEPLGLPTLIFVQASTLTGHFSFAGAFLAFGAEIL
jgi:hypothetical protein